MVGPEFVTLREISTSVKGKRQIALWGDSPFNFVTIIHLEEWGPHLLIKIDLKGAACELNILPNVSVELPRVVATRAAYSYRRQQQDGLL